MNSSDASANRQHKYRAFISYSHADEKQVNQLHRFLESYRVPKHLVGQTSSRGPIPKRLAPVFRDRDELPSATDLGEVISAALADSGCLIVICSPDAARSRWVNEEIQQFKSIHGEDKIVSLIVAGEPNASSSSESADEECFPPALRFRLGSDGELSDQPAEPVAADIRPGMDGTANARLKLIAGMLGVGFDDLRQREQQRRHRRMAVITAASLAGMIVAFGLATMAWLARAEAERQQARAEAEAETSRQTTSFLVDLFKVSDPSTSRGDEFSAHEILDKGAERVEQELADQPVIQATLMDTLGTVYTGLGSLDRASPLLVNALERRRRIYGNTHPEVAQSLNNLGLVLKLTDDFQESESRFREALRIRRELLGDSHPDVAQSINDLGDALTRQGQFDSAEELFREALAIRQESFGDDHPDVAQSLEDLALNLFDQGDQERPLSLLRNAVEIRYRVNGDPHPDLAEALNNLGFVLGELGEHDEAEELFENSLAMKRRLLPEPHAEIAMGLNNVAFVLHDKGEYEEAESAYREALAMQRQVFGNDHTDVARSLNNLAYLLYDKGELPAAIEMSAESMAINLAVLGERHPAITRSASNLALWHFEVGDYQSAEQILQRSLAIQDDMTDDAGPDVAGSMVMMAYVYVETGRFDEARDLAAQARQIFTSAFSADHWRTNWAASAEGAALTELGQFAEAETLLLGSHAVLTADRAVLPIFASKATRRLALLYEAWDKPDAAAPYVEMLNSGN